MPFREIFEQVLKESEVRLNEDKRGKKMIEIPLKQHFLNSKFDDGRKMYDSPEDLIAATVRTASGKYGIVRSVSKELDADGFPLKVVITADEDTPIKKGIEVSTEGMLAPREVRVATVDMNDETTKRVTGLINAGKSDDEIINDLFDPAQYQHSPENEQQVRDLLASVRSTLPKEEQSPSAKLLAQIKNRAVELGKANNIPVEDYIKSLDRADFLASAYDDITDEELVDDIKFFNEEAQKPNEPEEEIKEPAEGEEIDWEKELGESKLNEIRYQVIIPGLNDMDSMKDQRETSASSEKQAVANIVSRLARNTKGLKYQGIEISPQNIGLLISKIKAKVTRLTESKINEVKCSLCGKNTPITKDLEDASKAICGPCEKEEKMAKLTVEGKTQDAYDRLQIQLKTEKDEVKRRQLQDEISDIEDHWKQTWEAKNPEMSFHYFRGAIQGLLQSWQMIEHMENPLNYIKERLEALYKEMNESKEKPYIVQYGNNHKAFATKEEAETFKNTLSKEWEVKIIKESKVNEEEGLTGNTGVGGGEENTAETGIVGSEEEKIEEPVAAEPVAEEPKKVEDKPTKQYLGNNGSSDYFYFLEVMGNDGTVTELQVTDAEEKVIYTTKDSQMDVNDIAGFINAAIKAKEIANISTDILTKYLMPEEKPEAEVAQEEDKQALPEEEPKMESLMRKYKLDKVSDLMEKYKLNEEDEVIEEEPEEVPSEEPVADEAPVVDGPAEEPIVSPVPEEEGIEVPVEEPKTAEEAKTKIMLEYPEEPFTSLALAYADSLVNSPDVYNSIRQLQYEGQWVNADDFVKMAKVVGELNGFDGTETAKKLSDKFGGDSSKYRIGRNNFVVVDIVVRDMSAAHSLEAVKDLVGASAAEDMGEGMVRIQFGRKN